MKNSSYIRFLVYAYQYGLFLKPSSITTDLNSIERWVIVEQCLLLSGSLKCWDYHHNQDEHADVSTRKCFVSKIPNLDILPVLRPCHHLWCWVTPIVCAQLILVYSHTRNKRNSRFRTNRQKYKILQCNKYNSKMKVRYRFILCPWMIQSWNTYLTSKLHNTASFP